jgi:hypothetical protein
VGWGGVGDALILPFPGAWGSSKFNTTTCQLRSAALCQLRASAFSPVPAPAVSQCKVINSFGFVLVLSEGAKFLCSVLSCCS